MSIRWCFLLGLLIALVPRIGHADESSERAALRTLVKEAAARFDQGDFGEALSLFSDAYGRSKVATIGIYVARCQRELGRPIDAFRSYQNVLALPRDENPPSAVREAFAHAAAEKAALRKTLAFVEVIVRGGGGRHRVTLSGGTAAETLESGEWVAVPGSYQIRAEETGYLQASKTMMLEAGSKGSIELDLEPENAAGTGARLAPGPVFARDRGAEEERRDRARMVQERDREAKLAEGREAERKRRRKVLDDALAKRSSYVTTGYVALALGGVASLVSLYAYGSASSAKSDLDETCVSHQCPRESADKLESARSMARVAWWTGVSGLVLGAAGVAVLLAAPDTPEFALQPSAVGARIGGMF